MQFIIELKIPILTIRTCVCAVDEIVLLASISLLYATEAVLLNKSVMRTLYSLINRTVCKMFGSSAAENTN